MVVYQDILVAKPSTISWIGSMQIFLLFASGVFTEQLPTEASFDQSATSLAQSFR
ncbi:hypothetical protein AC578_132 [Pseudocercospora eumusae]|uniref:Uncharacterized protein n=1 Tax=Pseudocercospora eumusae TaxID=321146 RepID=A0A139GXU9_9PEZI|nr:hypothetical protein AC578_132 [Pseudocercospora eumusae]